MTMTRSENGGAGVTQSVDRLPEMPAGARPPASQLPMVGKAALALLDHIDATARRTLSDTDRMVALAARLAAETERLAREMRSLATDMQKACTPEQRQ